MDMLVLPKVEEIIRVRQVQEPMQAVSPKKQGVIGRLLSLFGLF